MLTSLLPAKFIDLCLERLNFGLRDTSGSGAPRWRGYARQRSGEAAARGPPVNLVELLEHVPVEWVPARLLVVGWQVLAHNVTALNVCKNSLRFEI